MIFLQMLGKLNASQQSQQTLAAFAVKNAALEEDLYSCILEVLESVRWAFWHGLMLSDYAECAGKHLLLSRDAVRVQPQGTCDVSRDGGP